MYWLKCLAVVSVTICLSQAFANDGGGAAGGGHGAEKPAAAGGEHGGKAPVVEKAFSGAQNDEWAKAQKDVQTAKIKFENDKKALEELKRTAEMQENLSKESLAKINEATKTMKTSEANYHRFLNQYNLRFPEKGLEPSRVYKRTDSERDGIETVEEKPQGVEAKLRRLNRNIKHQYLKNSEAAANSTENSKDPKKKLKKKQTSDESSENLPQPLPGDVTEKIKLEK
ncbi:hypothetical protein CIK05_01980 [Bdellovibrio sp. qaytius]|nr:hypothetical protein CIK05_01980 [Bdellovibrio sp. qaytius]